MRKLESDLALRSPILRNAGGIIVVAATFFYFLLFARFAYFRQLTSLFAKETLNFVLIMTAMGISGLISSFWTGRLLCYRYARLRFWVAGSALSAGFAAFFGFVSTGSTSQIMVGVLIGISLGVLTVSVSCCLRSFFNGRGIGFKVGLGTGLAYFLANAPFIAESSHKQLMILSMLAVAVIAVIGIFTSFLQQDSRSGLLPKGHSGGGTPWNHIYSANGVLSVGVLFFFIIGLDSGYFYFVDDTDGFFSGSWRLEHHGWIIAWIHLIAAVIAGWLLDHGHFFDSLTSVFVALVVGVLLIPGTNTLSTFAYGFYIVGVSAYSTLMVAWPSMASDRGFTLPISVRSAIIFGLGGWIGSGFGLIVAQKFGHLSAGPLIGLSFLFVLMVFLTRRTLMVRF